MDKIKFLGRLKEKPPEPVISLRLRQWLNGPGNNGHSRYEPPRGCQKEELLWMRWSMAAGGFSQTIAELDQEEDQEDEDGWQAVGNYVRPQQKRRTITAGETNEFSPTKPDLDKEDFAYLEQLDREVDCFEDRTRLTQQLSQRLREIEQYDEADSLRRCHLDGTHGIGSFSDGDETFSKMVVHWDHKCGMNKICPHCARIESGRLIGKYLPVITDWLSESPRRRVFYAVLTQPTMQEGQLDHGIKMLWEKLKVFQKATKRKHGELSHIKGSLVTLEAHATEKNEWHPHLNMIILVEGSFDYQHVWDAWSGGQCHIQPVRKENIQKSLREIFKYVAKHQGSAGGKPGILDWSLEQFGEFWKALEKIRRVRSYGVLFRVPKVISRVKLLDFEARGRIFFRDNQYWMTLVLKVNLIQEDNSLVLLKIFKKCHPPTAPPPMSMATL